MIKRQSGETSLTPLSQNMGSELYEKNCFDEDVKESIQDMKAVFDQKHGYFDTNAEPYRGFLTLIRQSAVQHILHLYDHPGEPSPYECALQKTCAMMNENEIYVDQMAKQKYLRDTNQKKAVETQFEKVRSNVSKVLGNLATDIPTWLEKLEKITGN
ncbi:unnamed protein product [Didymodactylos carnosus]|uniref:Uncharacterized protein n=1 Tax=Didymodactylos carnosus TaxID=1234261 RepID=A0A8S2NE10_9BILA|nr:unnamed protein product [Didymodactylos carnosus]CAF3998316.1 unnamed protein product [Didymodactylos carnosus]